MDSIAGQVGIDLDQINLSWLRRFLPATAVIVGMRYNSALIDEVIGVAQATFGPEPKLANRAITDDSASEAEVKPASDDNSDSKESEDNQDADKKSDEKDKATDKSSKQADEKGNSDKDSSDKEDEQNKVKQEAKVEK